MKDVTEKYANMLEAFECDFDLVINESVYKLSELQELIKLKDERLLKDIDLLKELSFNLRHNKARIYEEGEK